MTGMAPAKTGREEQEVSSETIPGFFAKGINFYKLFWVGCSSSPPAWAV